MEGGFVRGIIDQEKQYKFPRLLVQGEMEDFNWTFKKRDKAKGWGGFFHQYGITEINKTDFLNITKLSLNQSVSLRFEEISKELNDYFNASSPYFTPGFKNDIEKQRAIDRKIKIRYVEGALTNVTDVRFKKEALLRENYLCEINPEHSAFSLTSGEQFMEGHHVLPMKAQQSFDKRVDEDSNIAVLCPNCHRAIHYGTIEEKTRLLTILLAKPIHSRFMEKFDLSIPELIKRFY